MNGTEFVDKVVLLDLKHIVDLVIKGNYNAIQKCPSCLGVEQLLEHLKAQEVVLHPQRHK